MTDETEQIKEQLRKPRITRTAVRRKDLLSTGSTLLNLAMSGYPQGGIAKGWYVHFVGDSQCGKTFFAHQLLAEAANNAEFDDYRLIYDDAENGCLMNKEKYFGKKMAERLEPPAKNENGEPSYSKTAEEMYFNIYDLLTPKTANSKKPIKPIIYVMDSLDALSSEYENKKFKERRNANRKGTKAKGDYGDGKAKTHSGNMRQINALLRHTGSILFCISQTRDVLDGGMFGPQSTYSGGRALKFYTQMQLWGSVGPSIDKSVRGKKRKIGTIARIKVKKNRSTGKERTVEVPIYYSYGIDDLTGCVNFLADEHWKATGSTIIAPEFDFEGTAEELVEKIETEGHQIELTSLVTKVWNEIEKECELDRKPRYE